MPYAAARDGLFFAALRAAEPGAPACRSLASVLVSDLGARCWPPPGTFDQLTNMAVLSYALFWIPVVLAVIVLRRKLPRCAAPVPGARAIPFVPLLFVLVMAGSSSTRC